MATNQEILDKINEYVDQSYTQTETSLVPKKNDLTFGNTVKKIKHAKVFYIDLRKSKKILSDSTDFWSIKIHKSFLRIVIHCIEKRDGHVRSFNGDGVLAFFVGEKSASKAVKAALDIKAFVLKLNDKLEKKKKNPIDFGIGIGQGPIMVAKSGKGGDDQSKQDLVWIGIALYVSVELSEFAENPNNIWISRHVRDTISVENHLNVINNDGKSIWYKVNKNLKSVGSYEVRYTHFFSVI